MRLRRWPRSAEEWLSTLFQRVPPRARFLIITITFAALTTFFVSQYPLSVIPSYRPGDVARSDIIVPADLQSRDAFRRAAGGQLTGENPVLMHAGETITPENVVLVEAVRSYQIDQRDPQRLAGLFVLVLLMYFALYKTTVNGQASRLAPMTSYWVAASALMIQALLVRGGMFGAAVLSTRPETLGFGAIFEFQFAIPFAASALVLSLLIGSQVALVAGLMSAILVGFISPHDLAISAFSLAGSVTAIYSVQRYRTRNAVMVASSIIALVNIGMGLVAALINNHQFDWQLIIGGIVWSVTGALLTAATASFAIPIYESFFDILTDMRLMELSNAENPLLQQLAIQTPGTNHHSYMVAVLAEAASKAIGANALLARTGCLYHDIGKLAAPKMYIENQQGVPNPHDNVAPLDSVRIITGHVRRGLQMAKEADLPQQLIDFIPQHHGTRILAYFYHKAKAQAEMVGETVNMDDFRYPGPKPQTREAVILMLADGAEASVRSLDDPSPENIRAIIKKIIDSVVSDGQLDESNVTMRELTTIRESLIKTLNSVYHQRISYPGFNPTGKDEKQIAGVDQNGAVPGVQVAPQSGATDAQDPAEAQHAHVRGGQYP